jgi:YgiT-type zinc finger domain-containing protein
VIRLSTEKEEYKFQTLHCDRCKDWLRLEFRNFDKTVDDIHITVSEMPLLICPSCGEEYLPDRTKELIQWIVAESKRKGIRGVEGSPKSEASASRCDLCKDVNFKYDARDCNYIPGLQSVFVKEGFFTPVFFERKV